MINVQNCLSSYWLSVGPSSAAAISTERAAPIASSANETFSPHAIQYATRLAAK